VAWIRRHKERATRASPGFREMLSPILVHGLHEPYNVHPRLASSAVIRPSRSNPEGIRDFTKRCLLRLADAHPSKPHEAAFTRGFRGTLRNVLQTVLEAWCVRGSLAVEQVRYLAQSSDGLAFDFPGLDPLQAGLQLIACSIAPFTSFVICDHRSDERAERIIAAALGPTGARARIGWSGTFHAVGARLLRTHAHAIGLDPSFTIHDREDSADLMNLVRHERGLSERDKRFPLKATCLAVYSRAVNAREPLEAMLLKQFPWCAEWKDELRALFEAYVEAKQRQHVLDYDDLLLYWGELMQVPELASEVRQQFDHVLVDEYQDTNVSIIVVLCATRRCGAGLPSASAANRSFAAAA
jgi:hypothetical protein